MKQSPAFLLRRTDRSDAEKKVLTNFNASVFPFQQQSATAPNLRVSTSHHKPADEVFLQKVRSFVEQQLPDEIRVEDLAKALYSTRVQVFRKIKNLTGSSPTRFIRKIRLEKSIELLHKTDLSIAEIAYSVGFADPKYFTRVFVQAYGKAPSMFSKYPIVQIKLPS